MSMANMKDAERLELLKEIGGTKVKFPVGSHGAACAREKKVVSAPLIFCLGPEKPGT